MTYRDTLKRVFAETSLERKCRWWFGLSLGSLIFLSFYWYGSSIKKTVLDGVRRQAKQLVETAFREAHDDLNPRMFGTADATPLADEVDTAGIWEMYRDTMKEGRFYGTDFRWDTVLPPNEKNLNPPQDDTEQALLKLYMDARWTPPAEDAPPDPARSYHQPNPHQAVRAPASFPPE